MSLCLEQRVEQAVDYTGTSRSSLLGAPPITENWTIPCPSQFSSSRGTYMAAAAPPEPLSYHSGRKKAPSGPPGGHAVKDTCLLLCCSVYWTPVSTLPDYIKHWMHECPTAGRLRLQQSWWAVTPPPPNGPSSQTHSTSWLLICLSLPLNLTVTASALFCTSEDRVLVRTALHARLNLASSYSGQSVRTLLWVTKRSALIKISICCHREWSPLLWLQSAHSVP